MALAKSFDLDTGVTVTYWRVTWWLVNTNQRTITFELGAFPTAAISNAGKNPLLTVRFTMPVAPGVVFETLTRNDMYAYAKTASTARFPQGLTFADATDA